MGIREKGGALPDIEQATSIVRDRPDSPARPDRRTERTRRSLLTAFIELVLERGYASIGIADVVDRANVGRSTFYSHFRDKDDLLVSSMQWMFAILADATAPNCARQPVHELVEHFWANRRLAQVVLSPPIERKLRRALAAAIEDRLARTAKNSETLKLASVRIAAGQLGVLESWTKGEVAAAADTITDAIVAIARQ